MSSVLRCRACGASFPRSARPEDLCPPCRVARPHPSARSRVTLIAAAAVTLTAVSGMARLMIHEPADPVAAVSPEPAALPPLAPVPLAQPQAEAVVPAAVAVSVPEPATPRVARMIEFEDAGKATPPEPAPAKAAKPAALPVALAAAAKDLAPAAPVRPVVPAKAARTEESLRQELAVAPEVGLRGTAPLAFQALLAAAEARREATGIADWTDPSPLMRTQRDLRELPLHGGPGSRLNEREAGALDEHSRKLRVYLTATAPVGPDGRRPGAAFLAAKLRSERRGARPTWLRPEAIPALLQLLMHEDPPIRRMLVELLEDTPCPASTRALAQRASFDLDAEARQMAVEALRDRDPADYRPVFLKALRYPWAPAARHAAEALVALGDRAAVPELITLLQQPDPCLPHPLPGGRLVVQEVVRARHLANCILCHPPSVTGSETQSLGVDPVLTMAFPSATIKNKVVFSPQSGSLGQSSPSASLSQTAQQSLQRVQSTAGCHDYSNVGTSSSSPQSVVISPAAGNASANAGQSASNLGGNAPATPAVVRTRFGTNTLKFGGQTFNTSILNASAIQSVQSQPGQPRIVRTVNHTLTLLPMLIRGDITYLRQDFSLMLQVPDPPPGAPAARTRYDYFVRTRDATPAEKRALKAIPASESYPQREAVLIALRGLTGQDAGASTLAWRELFPQAEYDLKAARLSREVLQADRFHQLTLLGNLRDSKGLAYTLALAGAIPGLRGDMQETARQYLTDRLTRMTAETLRDKLGDDDPEVRRAAVMACTRKGKKELVPDLIALLGGDEPVTTRLAQAGLKELTGRDFEAPAAWQAWWQDQGRDGGPETQ